MTILVHMNRRTFLASLASSLLTPSIVSSQSESDLAQYIQEDNLQTFAVHALADLSSLGELPISWDFVNGKVILRNANYDVNRQDTSMEKKRLSISSFRKGEQNNTLLTLVEEQMKALALRGDVPQLYETVSFLLKNPQKIEAHRSHIADLSHILFDTGGSGTQLIGKNLFHCHIALGSTGLPTLSSIDVAEAEELTACGGTFLLGVYKNGTFYLTNGSSTVHAPITNPELKFWLDLKTAEAYGMYDTFRAPKIEQAITLLQMLTKTNPEKNEVIAQTAQYLHHRIQNRIAYSKAIEPAQTARYEKAQAELESISQFNEKEADIVPNEEHRIDPRVLPVIQKFLSKPENRTRVSAVQQEMPSLKSETQYYSLLPYIAAGCTAALIYLRQRKK